MVYAEIIARFWSQSDVSQYFTSLPTINAPACFHWLFSCYSPACQRSLYNISEVQIMPGGNATLFQKLMFACLIQKSAWLQSRCTSIQLMSKQSVSMAETPVMLYSYYIFRFELTFPNILLYIKVMQLHLCPIWRFLLKQLGYLCRQQQLLPPVIKVQRLGHCLTDSDFPSTPWHVCCALTMLLVHLNPTSQADALGYWGTDIMSVICEKRRNCT